MEGALEPIPYPGAIPFWCIVCQRPGYKRQQFTEPQFRRRTVLRFWTGRFLKGDVPELYPSLAHRPGAGRRGWVAPGTGKLGGSAGDRGGSPQDPPGAKAQWYL